MIRLGLRVKPVTLFTIGGGIGEVAGADILFIRKQCKGLKKCVYIPGSSFKGALRTAATRVARYYGFTSCGEVEPGRIKAAHSQEPCDVCRLFGYPDQPTPTSPLVVSDFEPVDPSVKLVYVSRVSVRDETLTAEQGGLYTVEHVVPGTEFKGFIDLYLKQEDETARLIPLLLLGLAELRMWRMGRGSLVDLKLENSEVLDGIVPSEWTGLLRGLKTWLWEGVL